MAGDLCTVGVSLQPTGAPAATLPVPMPSCPAPVLCRTARHGREPGRAATLLVPQSAILRQYQAAIHLAPVWSQVTPIRRTGPVYPLSPLGLSAVARNQLQQKPATGLSCRSIVRGITIRTLKNLSYFFRSRCSLVSEERQTELRIRNSSLGWGVVHCDTNVITRGPPATGVTENAKRGKSADLIIVAPAIP